MPPPSLAALEKTAAIDLCNIWSNVLEQDHRPIKRRVRASQHFRSFWGAWRTIAGYEAIHMIRKGQAWGKCAGCEGRYASSLHSWFCCELAKLPIICSTLWPAYKVATHPFAVGTAGV